MRSVRRGSGDAQGGGGVRVMARLMVKYVKCGDAAMLSHRECMRALERALRRSHLPLEFTAGFNPRPRMSFSPALPLGVAAEAEYLEVSVTGKVDEGGAVEALNRALPQGLRVREVRLLPPGMPKLSRWARYGLYRLEGEKGDIHLLLKVSGEGQASLRDAMSEVASRLGWRQALDKVTRVGLYASPEEVFEDVQGEVYYYDGERGELRSLQE